jgi:hypothetical protein
MSDQQPSRLARGRASSITRGVEMKLNVLFAAALMSASAAAVADHHMKSEKMDMKTMDANGDGMVSKDEFMKHHEMMYDKMKKNASGMVDMKEFEKMRHDMGMMHHDKPKASKDMKSK